MTDFDRLFEPLERVAAPDLWTEIEHRATMPGLLPGRRWSISPAFAVLAAAAAVLVLVGGVALLMSRGTVTPPGEEPVPAVTTTTSTTEASPSTTTPSGASTTTTPTITTSESPSDSIAEVPAEGWTRIGLRPLGAADFQNPNVLVPHNSGLLLVAQAPGEAVILTTSDGDTWRPVLQGVEDIELVTIAAGSAGYVAIGAVLGEPEAGGGSPILDPVFFFSKDGNTWSPIDDQSPFTGARIRGVADGPSGFVAVGSDEEQGGGLVWLSVDGVTWERLSSREFGFTTVAAGGPGYVATAYIDDPFGIDSS